MKKQSSIKLILLGFISVIIGVIIFILGIYFLKNSIDLKNNSVEIISTISNCNITENSDGDLYYTFYVDYSYNGETYENVKLSFNSSSWKVGDNLKILIDTRSPNKVLAFEFLYFFPNLCFIFALFFGGMGFVAIIKNVKKSKNIKNLIKNGRKSYAKVISVEEDYSTTINGVHPLVVICNFDDTNTGLVYEVKSDKYINIPIDLEGYFVAIYVDVNDISNYYIDIDDVKVEENFI